jgi:hypothetical protein
MTDDDPNEAYEVVPIVQPGRGPPDSWWTVTRNGIDIFPAGGRLCGTRPILNIEQALSR